MEVFDTVNAKYLDVYQLLSCLSFIILSFEWWLLLTNLWLWLQVNNCHLRYTCHTQGRKKEKGGAKAHLFLFTGEQNQSWLFFSQKISLCISFFGTVWHSSPACKGTWDESINVYSLCKRRWEGGAKGKKGDDVLLSKSIY